MSRWGVFDADLTSDEHPLQHQEKQTQVPTQNASSSQTPISTDTSHDESHVGAQCEANVNSVPATEASQSQGARGYLRSTMWTLGSYIDSFKSNSTIARYGIETTTGLVNKLPSTVKDQVSCSTSAEIHICDPVSSIRMAYVISTSSILLSSPD